MRSRVVKPSTPSQAARSNEDLEVSEDGQQIRRGAVSGELDSEKLFLDSEQAARGNGDLEVSEDGQQLRRISPVPEGDVTIDRSLSGGLRS